MLKIHGLNIKGEVILVTDLPTLRQLMIRPMTATGRRTHISGIILLPAGMLMGGIPDYLGIGAHQGIFTPALQPLTVRGI